MWDPRPGYLKNKCFRRTPAVSHRDLMLKVRK